MMQKISIVVLLLAPIFIGAGPLRAEQTMREEVADFNGVQVHYKTSGGGPNALVFVHGWTCNANFWRHSLAEFPGYRTIAVDLPGHGQSDKPRVEYSMDYFARALAAVLRDANIKQAVLVGHSMGTLVIRQFYRLYPHQTLGLVVVDGMLRPVPQAEAESILARFRVNYRAAAVHAVEEMLQPIDDQDLKRQIRPAMLDTPAHVGLSAMEGMLEKRIWTDDKISVPVLAVLAASSGWKADTEAYYRSVAPELEFHMWPDVSHFLMMERPEEFNALVKAFVVKHKLL